jgi:hypothetical protein
VYTLNISIYGETVNMRGGTGMLKALLLAGAWVACTPACGAQERFDPVAFSAGGVWIRDGGDPWCVLDAQTNLAAVASPRVGVVYMPGAFLLSDLEASALTFVFPLPPGGAGIALTRFGSEIYSEQAGVIAWGGGSLPLRYGAALRYTRFAIHGYGSAGVVSADAAVLIAPLPWMRAGVRLTDINRPPLGASGERLPSTLSIAAMATLPGFLDVSAQVGEDTGGELSARGGLSIRCSPWMLLRCGASENFRRLHAGLDLDGYGLTVDPVLGWSHCFSLTFIPPI